MNYGKRLQLLWDSVIHWIGRRSLQSRLIAAYVFIILGPCLLVSLYSYKAINNMNLRDAQSKSLSLLDMEQLHIHTQIESMARAAQVAYDDPEVNDYLIHANELDSDELLNFGNYSFKYLTRIQYYNPNVKHLRLYSSSNIVEIWPIFFRESRVKDESWFKKAEQMNGMESWSFQNNDPDVVKRYKEQTPAPTPKVSLLRELSVPIGNHVGMVQVDMLLENFSPRTYSVMQDSNSQMLLADSDANTFTREEDSFLETSPGMEKGIKERLQRFEETGEWDIHYKENGKSFLLLHQPVERIDAHLINIVSMEGVLKTISYTRNLLIGANIGFITLVTLIAYILNAFILKNLRLLTEEMKKVRRGEAYSGISIRGGGEIGELAHHFSKLMNTINTLVAEAVYKQALTKEAELRSLYNQIDAHFLFNTLENIKMLAEIENQILISDALASLGGMMRYNFKWSGEYAKMRDEIRHIENYIKVMNIRFDEPILLKIDIPEDALEMEMLKMSLQPIVENAVKHAWVEEEKAKIITIELQDWQQRNVRIVVTDNGGGMQMPALSELNYKLESIGMNDKLARSSGALLHRNGIGLRNVQERIRLYYGNEYGLKVFSEQGQYTRVVMILPMVLLTGRRGVNDKSDDRR